MPARDPQHGRFPLSRWRKIAIQTSKKIPIEGKATLIFPFFERGDCRQRLPRAAALPDDRAGTIGKISTEERFNDQEAPQARLAAYAPRRTPAGRDPAGAGPKTEVARLLGVSRQTLYDILEEKQPVTPMMALRLGKLCGNGPDLWLNLQKRYDLRRAEQALGAKIKAIPTLEVA
jgi:addiction module HigA family antidote